MQWYVPQHRQAVFGSPANCRGSEGSPAAITGFRDAGARRKDNSSSYLLLFTRDDSECASLRKSGIVFKTEHLIIADLKRQLVKYSPIGNPARANPHLFDTAHTRHFLDRCLERCATQRSPKRKVVRMKESFVGEPFDPVGLQVRVPSPAPRKQRLDTNGDFEIDVDEARVRARIPRVRLPNAVHKFRQFGL
jgi:hypothetical protein